MLLLCRGSALKSVRETAEFLLPPSLITIDKTSPLLLSVMASVCAMYTIRRMKSISFPSFDLPLLLLFFLNGNETEGTNHPAIEESKPK